MKKYICRLRIWFWTSRGGWHTKRIDSDKYSTFENTRSNCLKEVSEIVKQIFEILK